MDNQRLWFERNERAEELESQGETDKALELYLKNAEEGCDTAFTYDRLAAIYRNREMHDEEIEALETALKLEQRRGISSKRVLIERRLKTAQGMQASDTRPKRAPKKPQAHEEARLGGAAAVKKQKGCLSFALLLVTAITGLAAFAWV